jgi:hypothetical protein
MDLLRVLDGPMEARHDGNAGTIRTVKSPTNCNATSVSTIRSGIEGSGVVADWNDFIVLNMGRGLLAGQELIEVFHRKNTSVA